MKEKMWVGDLDAMKKFVGPDGERWLSVSEPPFVPNPNTLVVSRGAGAELQLSLGDWLVKDGDVVTMRKGEPA